MPVSKSIHSPSSSPEQVNNIGTLTTTSQHRVRHARPTTGNMRVSGTNRQPDDTWGFGDDISMIHHKVELLHAWTWSLTADLWLSTPETRRPMDLMAKQKLPKGVSIQNKLNKMTHVKDKLFMAISTNRRMLPWKVRTSRPSFIYRIARVIWRFIRSHSGQLHAPGRSLRTPKSFW